MMLIRRLFLPLVLMTTAPLLSAHERTNDISPTAFRAKLEAFVNAASAELNIVPGLSVAVVRGNQTIYAGGFGYADLAARKRVTRDTVFYTASLAKSVTGMTVATLIAEGRLSMDTPLTRLFPGLSLPAGTDASKATLAGLLGHDPGFGSPTVNYVTTFVRPYDMAELVRVMNTYSQTLPRFTYANSNYTLAGMIIEATTRHPWKDEIAARVFAPLGMRRSTFHMSGGAGGAVGYRADRDGFTPIRLPKSERTMTGAGGFYSTATDLAELVKAYLGDGTVDGRQRIPAAAVKLTKTKNTSLSADFAYFKRTGYGIGLYLGTYDDEPLLHHFGGITGYRAHLSFMPQRGLGVVVLQNEGGDGSQFADLVATYAYDLLLGRDADARGKQRLAEYRATLDRSRAQPLPGWMGQLKQFTAAPAVMALPIGAYAGSYRSDRLGAIEVAVDGSGLKVTFGEMRGRAVPIGGNDVLVDYGGGDAPDAWKFSVTDGKVTGFDWGGRLFAKVQ